MDRSNEHLDRNELIAQRCGSLSEAASKHLSTCAICQRAVDILSVAPSADDHIFSAADEALVQELTREPDSDRVADISDAAARRKHATDEQIFRYWFDHRGREDHTWVDGHLASCEECSATAKRLVPGWEQEAQSVTPVEALAAQHAHQLVLPEPARGDQVHYGFNQPIAAYNEVLANSIETRAYNQWLELVDALFDELRQKVAARSEWQRQLREARLDTVRGQLDEWRRLTEKKELRNKALKTAQWAACQWVDAVRAYCRPDARLDAFGRACLELLKGSGSPLQFRYPRPIEKTSGKDRAPGDSSGTTPPTVGETRSGRVPIALISGAGKKRIGRIQYLSLELRREPGSVSECIPHPLCALMAQFDEVFAAAVQAAWKAAVAMQDDRTGWQGMWWVETKEGRRLEDAFVEDQSAGAAAVHAWVDLMNGKKVGASRLIVGRIEEGPTPENSTLESVTSGLHEKAIAAQSESDISEIMVFDIESVDIVCEALDQQKDSRISVIAPGQRVAKGLEPFQIVEQGVSSLLITPEGRRRYPGRSGGAPADS